MAFSDSDTSTVDMMSDAEEDAPQHTRQRSSGNFDNIVGTPRGIRNSWSSIGRRGSFSGKRKPEPNLAQQVSDLDSSGSDGIPSYIPQCKRPPICPPSTPPAVKGTGIRIEFCRRSSAGTSSAGSPLNSSSRDKKGKIGAAPFHQDPEQVRTIPKLDLKTVSKPLPPVPSITVNPILGLAGGGDQHQSQDSKSVDSKSADTPSMNEVGDQMVFSEPGSPKVNCFSDVDMDDDCNTTDRQPANDLTDIASSAGSSCSSSRTFPDDDDMSLPRSNPPNQRRRNSPTDLSIELSEKDKIISDLKATNETLSQKLNKSEEETRLVITKYAECMGKLSGEGASMIISPRNSGSIEQEKKISEMSELMKSQEVWNFLYSTTTMINKKI